MHVFIKKMDDLFAQLNASPPEEKPEPVRPTVRVPPPDPPVEVPNPAGFVESLPRTTIKSLNYCFLGWYYFRPITGRTLMT